MHITQRKGNTVSLTTARTSTTSPTTAIHRAMARAARAATPLTRRPLGAVASGWRALVVLRVIEVASYVLVVRYRLGACRGRGSLSRWPLRGREALVLDGARGRASTYGGVYRLRRARCSLGTGGSYSWGSSTAAPWPEGAGPAGSISRVFFIC